jgi:hypothetical protein
MAQAFGSTFLLLHFVYFLAPSLYQRYMLWSNDPILDMCTMTTVPNAVVYAEFRNFVEYNYPSRLSRIRILIDTSFFHAICFWMLPAA